MSGSSAGGVGVKCGLFTRHGIGRQGGPTGRPLPNLWFYCRSAAPLGNVRRRFLGPHVVGADAGDVGQEVVLALQAGVSVGPVAQVIHPYPSRTEGVLKAAEEYWRQKLFSGGLSTAMRWWTQRTS